MSGGSRPIGRSRGSRPYGRGRGSRPIGRGRGTPSPDHLSSFSPPTFPSTTPSPHVAASTPAATSTPATDTTSNLGPLLDTRKLLTPGDVRHE